MLVELIDLYGLEIMLGFVSLLTSVALRELRKRGLVQAAAILEASTPYIVDALAKGRKKIPTSGDYAMRQGKKAALRFAIWKLDQANKKFLEFSNDYKQKIKEGDQIVVVKKDWKTGGMIFIDSGYKLIRLGKEILLFCERGDTNVLQ